MQYKVQIVKFHESTFNLNEGSFTNHVDTAGGGDLAKCQYYYISLIY